MNCAGYERAIALWVEGDLPARQAAGLEAHLQGCPACREFAAGQRASQAALKALPAEPTEADLAVVRQRILTRLRSEQPARRPLGWAYGLAGALAAALVAWVLIPRPSPQAPPRPAAPARVEVRRPAPASGQTSVVGRRGTPRPKPAERIEPLVVKLYTDDPEVILYWVIEKKGD